MSRSAGAPKPAPNKKSSNRNRISSQMLFAIIGGVLVSCSLLGVTFSEIVSNLQQPAVSTPDATRSDAPDVYEQALREKIAANPNDAAARDSLANLLSVSGRNEEAFALYDEAVKIDPSNPRYRIDFGVALSTAGKQADAELQFQRALEADPNNADAYYYLGELYRRWQPARPSEAARAYSAAIAASPESFSAEEAQKALASLGGIGTPFSESPVLATPVLGN